MPAVWRRGPRLVNVASGLAHRSAQHLTPLRGRPPPRTRGRWRGKEPRSLYRDRRSRRGPVPTGPRTLRRRAFPREGPAANYHVAVDIQTRPKRSSSQPILKISVISGSDNPQQIPPIPIQTPTKTPEPEWQSARRMPETWVVHVSWSNILRATQTGPPCSSMRSTFNTRSDRISSKSGARMYCALLCTLV